MRPVQIGAAIALLATLPAVAVAGLPEPVAVIPFEYPGDAPGLGAGFRRLLEVELSRSVTVQSVRSAACGEIGCATEVARRAGARTVVFGSLVPLGRKIQVVAIAADVHTGRTLAMADLAVGSAEELDVAAERLAPALLGDQTVEEGAQLGAISSEEAEADLRRDGDHGLGLRLAGFMPLGDGYSNAKAGLEVGVGYGFETRHVLIEPRIGLRWSVDPDGARFFEVPIDIGAYYILSAGDFAPFFGGGIGFRYITDRRERTIRTGAVIQTTTTREVDDSSWAFGGFARAGLFFMRTYAVRLSLSVDYGIALTELNGVSNPQSVALGVGVHF